MSNVMTIFAGVNGSGKSTLTRNMSDYVGIVLDPDAIARDLKLESVGAGREVIRRVQDCIREGISFSLETTLSGKLPFRQIKDAQKNGFYVRMFYVGLRDVELCKERIAVRVNKGGHNIPSEDVERRYPKSMNNLKEAIKVCDEVLVYDNSIELELVKVYQKGKVVYTNDEVEVSWVPNEMNLF